MFSHQSNNFITILIGLAGGFLFSQIGLPLPWLLGPMFACLVVAVAGVNLRAMPLCGNGARSVLGVAVGATVTPALLMRLDEMLLSVALIPLCVVCIGIFGYPYFRKIWKLDKNTAYYAAMPGGLQDMVLFGEEAGGSVRVLSLIHATRLLIIVSSLPLVLQVGLGLDLSQAFGERALALPTEELLLMPILAVVGWWGARKMGMFGASILGPMILTAVFSLVGLLHHRPPNEAILLAQFFIGINVGAKYNGITIDEIRRTVASAIGYTIGLMVIGGLFAFAVTRLQLAPAVDALLAFSPGGQAEMTVLAIVASADIAFVVTHHIVRICLVILLAPVFQKLLR